MRDTDYAQAIGVIREQEKKILGAETLLLAIESTGVSDALSVLGRGSYDFAGLENAEDYPAVLDTALYDLYAEMYKLSPEPLVADIPRAKYEYHNLKTALKAFYAGMDGGTAYISAAKTDAAALRAAIGSWDFKGIPEHLAKACEKVKVTYEQSQDPQKLDTVLDSEMFSYMLSLCEQLNSEFVTGYVRTWIDFYNLKTFMRVKDRKEGVRYLKSVLMDNGFVSHELFVRAIDQSVDAMNAKYYYQYFGGVFKKFADRYEADKNFSSLEKYADEYLLEMIKQSRYIAFGPAPLFCYILTRENEMRQIRIIMTCKINAINQDVAKERLRDFNV